MWVAWPLDSEFGIAMLCGPFSWAYGLAIHALLRGPLTWG